MTKLRKIIIYLSLWCTSMVHAGTELHIKNSSTNHYEFFIKEQRDLVLIGMDGISIPVYTDTVAERYFHVTKKNNKWQATPFSSSNSGLMKDYQVWSKNNLAKSYQRDVLRSGDNLVARIWPHEVTLHNYKTKPTVSSRYIGKNHGLVRSSFQYPVEHELDEQEILLRASTTETGKPSFTVPIIGSGSSVLFADGQFSISNLEALQKNSKASVQWNGNLKTVAIEGDDNTVTYYFQNHTWRDVNSGIVDPAGNKWAKQPSTMSLLTHIGMCVTQKSSNTTRCRQPVQLDYGQTAEEISKPRLTRLSQPSVKTTDFNYNSSSPKGYISSIRTYNHKSGEQSSNAIEYARNSQGQPTHRIKVIHVAPDAKSRKEVRYAQQQAFQGLEVESVDYQTIDNQEFKTTQTATSWIKGANNEPLAERIEKTHYDRSGKTTLTVETDSQFDAKNRLIEREITRSNQQGESIEERITYAYTGDYLTSKQEQKTITSPAYEGGVSPTLERSFQYSYANELIAEQTTTTGAHTVREVFTYNSDKLPTQRQRFVNGQLSLNETLTYANNKVTRRCENNHCISYQYENRNGLDIEKSFYNGTVYKEVALDASRRPVSVTVRGTTKTTQYYAAGQVPSELQSWLAACPANTESLTFIDQPKQAICETPHGQFSVTQGLDGQFIVSGKEAVGGQTKTYLPHFDGEQSIVDVLTESFDEQSIEHTREGKSIRKTWIEETQTRHELLDGEKIQFTDISGLTYKITDAQGREIRFYHNARGQVVSSILNDDERTRIRYDYDDAGRRVQFTDPVKGVWSYGYNNESQLAWQEDANGERTIFEYDNLNRITRIQTPYNTVCQTYPTTLPVSEPETITKVHASVASCDQAQTQYQERRSFSWPQGWVTQRDITAPDGSSHTIRYEYDAQGRVVTEHLPSKFGNSVALAVDYKNNQAYQWRDSVSGTVYKTIVAMDAMHRATHIRFGNGIEEYRTYSDEAGDITSIRATRSGKTLYHFHFSYDAQGRLTERQRDIHYRHQVATSLTDAYEYDDANRLIEHSIKQVCLAGQCFPVNVETEVNAASSYTYDDYGNITSKGGTGTYEYDVNKITQLTRVTQEDGVVRNFTYDANGNLLSDGLRTFTYEDNRVTSIQRVGEVALEQDQVRFIYDAKGRQLVRTERRFDNDLQQNIETSTYLIGAYSFTKHQTDSAHDKEVYAGQGFAIQCTQANSCQVNYAHHDRLGHQWMVSNEQGHIVSQSFVDPFGAKHHIFLPDSITSIAQGAVVNQHGQSSLDGMDVVHMHGRIYDPFLGRFLQADPFIDGAEEVAGYNRYAYLHNNPVNAIDPSGYGFLSKISKPFRKPFKKITRAPFRLVQKTGKELGRFGKRTGKELGRFGKRTGKELGRFGKRTAKELGRWESSVRNEAKRFVKRVDKELGRWESDARNELKRFESRTRHEVKRWESDARHGVKIIGKVIKENPEIVLAMAAAAWVGPLATEYIAMHAFGAAASTATTSAFATLTISQQVATAAIAGSAMSATSHVVMNKGSLRGIEKSIVMGAATGAISAYVPHGLMGLQSNQINSMSSFGRVAASTAIKAAANAAVSRAVYGTSFQQGFKAGVLMSSANIGISSTNMGQFSSLMVSSVAGGMITSSIYGGEFSDAFAMGFVQSAVDLSFNDWNGHFDMTPQEVTETVLDVIPIVSNVKSLYEFSAGHSIFGEPLTDTQRALAGATIFLGAAGGIMKSGTKFAVKRAPTLKSGSGLGVTKRPRRKLPFTDNDRLTEINKTLDRIESNGPFPHKRDGITFKNREGKLPEGNYKEYTVDTPSASNRGARRVVKDQNTGNTYYTDDHYESFLQIDPKRY